MSFQQFPFLDEFVGLGNCLRYVENVVDMIACRLQLRQNNKSPTSKHSLKSVVEYNYVQPAGVFGSLL